MKLPVVYDDIPRHERWLVREEYIDLQKGLCYHCGVSLDEEPANEVLEKKVDKNLFPPGFFNNPHHLHHSHETGLTIGVVHAYCNAVLWQYEGE